MNLCDFGCGQEAKYQFKTGRKCCSKNAASCPEIRKKSSDAQKKNGFFTTKENPNYVLKKCKFCGFITTLSHLVSHEKLCYLNPLNIRYCPVCNQPIKNYKHNKTCSHKCANKIFKQNTKFYENEEEYGYRWICFKYHEKKCVVCGEDKIVTVHHFDENHKNDSPKNLIPMCPTHQFYMHSKYKYLIEDLVIKYREDFIKNFAPIV